MQYYGEHATDLEITNQLDDGLLRYFARGESAAAERRLAQMLATARDEYGARAAMITCSAVPPDVMASLAGSAGIPLLKIDNPMAEEAVKAGRRLGVVITFRPTTEPTTRLLQDAARSAGTEIELCNVVVPEAYEALLGGRADEHDRLLLAKIDELAGQGLDGIVLAQVSMARLLPKLAGRIGIPVFSSLPSSLGRMRQALA
jgi:Asp/Glu/hydantoin racemase